MRARTATSAILAAMIGSVKYAPEPYQQRKEAYIRPGAHFCLELERGSRRSVRPTDAAMLTQTWPLVNRPSAK